MSLLWACNNSFVGRNSYERMYCENRVREALRHNRGGRRQAVAKTAPVPSPTPSGDAPVLDRKEEVVTDKPIEINVPRRPAVPVDVDRIGGSTFLITLRSMAGCFFSFLIFGGIFLAWNIGIIPFLFLLMILPSWGYFGGKIGLSHAKATAASAFDVRRLPREHPLAKRVYALSRLAGLRTMPEVALYRHPGINAFACGRGRDNSLVALTETAVQRLNENELNAVIAHEVAHIANNDMRRLCFAEAFQNSLVMALMSTHVKEWARLIMFSINELLLRRLSRQREYRADALAAALVGPEAMVGALIKLDQSSARLRGREQNRLRLLQINSEPSALLSTHPPIKKRIQAVQSKTFMNRLPML